MQLRAVRVKWPSLLAVAVVAGTGIAAVDNLANQGEVSPIVIVVLLLAATATVGGLGGVRRSAATLAVWVWLPLIHLVKRVLDLPDTLHPNTYLSILMLAAFTLVVAALGTGCGLMVRMFAIGFAEKATENPEPNTADGPRD
jgi:hypothetical protein